jgi:uncharacterized protein (TIGR02453 family)
MLQADTLQFFRELRLNNNKDWFDANRHRYEHAKKDYHQLVRKILDGLQKHDQGLFQLQVKDCTFRINRDIRFSKDKQPYKTHLGIIMSPYGRRLEHAGYYVHLDEEGGCFAGGGIYMPSGEVLKKIRQEISVFYEDLVEVVESEDFREVYEDFDREDGVVLSRPPKGYSADDPAIEFLKLKSYTATKAFPAEWLTDETAVDRIVNILAKLKPLVDFLNRALKEQ